MITPSLRRLCVSLTRLAHRSLVLSGCTLGRCLSVPAAALLCLSAASPATAQAPATGSVEGRVKNVVTGENLNNARVALKGTNRFVFTDESGAFRLGDLPAGPITLRVFFTGLDEQEVTVNVAAGQTVTQDLSLTSKARYGTDTETVRLDVFTVQSKRETNAAAIAVNEQRVARNIKSVVAAEEFGTIPDTNPGELLKWLPGVGVEYFANNITGVNVRGLGAVNTEISFDGMPMASANADGTGRTFELAGASSSDISRVEVRKLPLPEDSANSIGGSINLIRRSAFEASRRRIEYLAVFTSDGEKFTFGQRKGPRDRTQDQWQPNWQLKWTEPITKNLGFVVTMGQNSAIVNVHWNNPTWSYGSAAQKTAADSILAAGGTLPNTVSLYNPAMTQMLLHDSPTKDQKDFANVRVDWRPVRQLTLGYAFSYAKALSSQGDDIRYTWNTAATGSGDPQYVDRRTVVGRALGGAIFYNAPLWRNVSRPTNAHNLEAAWKQDGWTASFKGGWSQSKNYISSTENGFFNSTTGGGVLNTGVGFGTANPIPITVTFRDVDYRGPRQIEAKDAAGNIVDWSSAAVARIGGAIDRPGRAVTDVTSTRMFVKRDFNFYNPLSVQLGYDYSEEYRNRRYGMKVWNFVGADHLPSTADDTASQIKTEVLTRSGDTFAHTPALDHISLSRLYKLYQDHPDYFVFDPNQSLRNTVTNTYSYTETNHAPYLEFFQGLFGNRLQLAGGVRYEKNISNARGYKLDQSAAYRKYSDGSVVHAGDVLGSNGLPVTRAGAPVFLAGVTSGSLAEAQLIMKENGATGHSDNDNFFPSLHATYDLTANWKLQAGYARTQAKNRIDRTVIPNTTVVDTIQTNGAIGQVSLRNTDLKPWVGDNVDLRLSYYSESGGNIGIGVFTKRIKNWQASDIVLIENAAQAASYGLDPQYVGYNVSTLFNNGTARIDGAEYEMRQSLDRILPRWAKGITASITYSYTNLIGQAPNTDLGSVYDYRGTVFLTYSARKFSGSLGYLRNGTNANGVNTAAGVTSIQTQVPEDMFDFNAEYRLTRHIQLFASGKNILGEWRLREVRYPGVPNYAALNSSTNRGVTFSLGVKGEF
jgi:iron complex outermembrane receptor protein